MSRETTTVQLRVDIQLKNEFVKAARTQKLSQSEAMRKLMVDFVKQARGEAARQSRLVASASDASETMDDVMCVQAWLLS